MNLTVDALPPEKLERAIATAMELTMHATGNYPAWWQGWRFDRAIRAWACGETSEVVRETMQLLLLGEPGQHGTGCIPKAALVEIIPARGLADLVDMIRVHHAIAGHRGPYANKNWQTA